MAITIEHVKYVYDEGSAMASVALNDVSTTIGDGEFIGLIGHTGSGKSTFVQLLNGLLKPSEGRILFDGEDIGADHYDLRSLRFKVGLVFQYPEHQLFEEDVFTDVCFGPKNLGLSPEEQKKRAAEALSMVGIGEDMYTMSPFEMSGGQKRRVAIAGVLAMGPRVLILDEPTAGLDPKGRKEILDLISKLHREAGCTVILVSHSMEDVASYVGRILVMDKGNIVLDGAPRDVFSHVSELESMGLAAPQVTYIMEYLKGIGVTDRADAITLDEAAAIILESIRV